MIHIKSLYAAYNKRKYGIYETRSINPKKRKGASVDDIEVCSVNSEMNVVAVKEHPIDFVGVVVVMRAGVERERLRQCRPLVIVEKRCH